MLKKTLVAAATTLAFAGVTATGASAAYDLTGGNFTATSGSYTFGLAGGAYTFGCANASFSGNTENVPGEPNSTLVTPTLSGCEWYGFPVVATTPDPWKLSVTGGTGGAYEGTLDLPAGAVMKFEIPLVGWSWTYAPSQRLADVSIDGTNPGGLFGITFGDGGLSYTSVQGPVRSGSDGTSISMDDLAIPGVSVDEL